MRELKNVEEKILDATLYLIGKTGTCNVPIRAIAKEAGVNVCAINYYFRTKEEMLRHTKEFFVNNSIGIYSILDNEEYSKEDRLVLFANEIMEYTLHYSGLAAIFKESDRLKEEDEISRTILQVTKELHNKMMNILYDVTKSDPFASRYNSVIFMSALVYPSEKPEFYNHDRNFLTEKEQRIAYIKHIINLMK